MYIYLCDPWLPRSSLASWRMTDRLARFQNTKLAQIWPWVSLANQRWPSLAKWICCCRHQSDPASNVAKPIALTRLFRLALVFPSPDCLLLINCPICLLGPMGLAEPRAMPGLIFLSVRISLLASNFKLDIREVIFVQLSCAEIPKISLFLVYTTNLRMFI